ALAPRMGNGSKGDDKKALPPLEFTSAEVVKPALVTMPVTVEFSGPLVAPRTALVRAKASGTLLSLNVAEGSRVKLGQMLGEIDLADLQSRVADRAASVEVAQAALTEAERQHTANVELATLELAGTVGTHEVSRLAPGMPVQVRIEGQSADVTGQLARIAPAAEAGTRSIGVTIELANPKETFRAGQYAIAKVVLADP